MILLREYFWQFVYFVLPFNETAVLVHTWLKCLIFITGGYTLGFQQFSSLMELNKNVIIYYVSKWVPKSVLTMFEIQRPNIKVWIILTISVWQTWKPVAHLVQKTTWLPRDKCPFGGHSVFLKGWLLMTHYNSLLLIDSWWPIMIDKR